MRFFGAALFVFIIAVLIWCAPASVAGNSADALARTKCTHCHNAERICKRIGRYNTVMWQKTIDKMKRKGATISASEKAIIAQHLGSARPGQLPLCN